MCETKAVSMEYIQSGVLESGCKHRVVTSVQSRNKARTALCCPEQLSWERFPAGELAQSLVCLSGGRGAKGQRWGLQHRLP